jgi:serine/threonine-protein kinase
MGVTIYELLTGRVPFLDGDIAFHHRHTPPTSPRELNNQITPELEKIILKCMAKDPGQRYQSARQIYEDILRSFGPGRK